MGRADSPLLLDVRREEQFQTSRHLLATGQRCAPENVAAFAALQPLCEVVVYCVHGHNASAEAVATLRAAGWNASALAGGIEGGEDGVDRAEDIRQWRAHRPLTVLKRPDWRVTGEQASRWITRERPKIDRVACPWLIRRFIDPRAGFFYVPTQQVLEEARRLQAVAFDIPGAPVSQKANCAALTRCCARLASPTLHWRRWPGSCAAPTPTALNLHPSRRACWPCRWACRKSTARTTTPCWRLPCRSMTRCMPGAAARKTSLTAGGPRP